MIRAFSGTIQTVEGAGLGGLVLLLAVAVLFLALAAVLSRSARGTRQAAGPQIQPQIVEALSVYLGGNRDSARLRAMATAHPDEVQETILRYQTIVAGQREELCELTIVLGYVQRWCRQTRFAGIVERRKAFSCLSAVAHYEGVRRLAGDIPANAFRDPDEQIRLEAARILLSTNEPAEIGRVFEGILSDTPGVRLVIGRELGRYATQLCQTAVPRALRSQSPLEVLRLLVSWERALPLPERQPARGTPGSGGPCGSHAASAIAACDIRKPRCYSLRPHRRRLQRQGCCCRHRGLVETSKSGSAGVPRAWRQSRNVWTLGHNLRKLENA